MRRIAEAFLVILGLAGIAFLAAGILGPEGAKGGAGGGEARQAAARSHYHSGKEPFAVEAADTCRSAKCHPGLPHRKGGAPAAFRNMHLKTADCLSCHGREPERFWEGRREGGRWKLRYAGSPGGGGKHDALGTPMSCRRCHSADGGRRLAGRGMKDLPTSFEDPVSLRMMESGARQWSATP